MSNDGETVLTLNADEVDEAFDQHDWSDGLPIVAPTRERVDAMLGRWLDEADADIGTIPPRHGIASYRILAVNCVMAGCKPAYFPIVIAAVEAMLDPAFNLFAVQATTHPCAPCVIVNGPIVAEVGLNGRYGAFGPGVRANATIGRAIRLILMNVGGARPGILDRATLGQPSKYSYCIAENENESPWDPLHVERGCASSDSAVTVTAAENPHNINDHVSATAEGVLATVTHAMTNQGCNNAYLQGQPALVLGPEHAAIVAAGGFDKRKLKAHLYAQTQLSREQWKTGGMADMFDDHFAGAEMIPMVETADDFIIFVAGGFGRHSAWLPTFGNSTRAVTRLIPSEPTVNA